MCVCYSSAFLFTGSLGAFIHRVCARSSFFLLRGGWHREKKRQRRKKTRTDGLVHRRVYYKKKQKRRRSDRDEKRQSSRWTREKKKKERWEETGWSISIIGMRTTRKCCHQSGEKKRRDGKKLYSHSTEKREKKKCVYTESGQQHVLPNKSHCIHFPVIRASSSSRLHIYIYNIEERWGKEDACNALSKGFQSHT